LDADASVTELAAHYDMSFAAVLAARLQCATWQCDATGENRGGARPPQVPEGSGKFDDAPGEFLVRG
jgi:hypothetical protein